MTYSRNEFGAKRLSTNHPPGGLSGAKMINENDVSMIEELNRLVHGMGGANTSYAQKR